MKLNEVEAEVEKVRDVACFCRSRKRVESPLLLLTLFSFIVISCRYNDYGRGHDPTHVREVRLVYSENICAMQYTGVD